MTQYKVKTDDLENIFKRNKDISDTTKKNNLSSFRRIVSNVFGGRPKSDNELIDKTTVRHVIKYIRNNIRNLNSRKTILNGYLYCLKRLGLNVDIYKNDLIEIINESEKFRRAKNFIIE
ncbi:MAG: hypothetical protein Hyperionvirus29_36 [Hyperionvirus sp.]|uniref:Uncharacterized protein n=1 Tax=Hyperionvirus sp. TaxID=2487770 RepID=A0A3G5AFC0_9VIRU|nr:MAG: hypothetical protein Hyperionvirus29_36 [Hyperionvirus sp.]